MKPVVDIATAACTSLSIAGSCTKKQMREATKYREFLLDEGFEMSQFSVYARFCNGKDAYGELFEANRDQPAGKGRRECPHLHRPAVREHRPIREPAPQKTAQEPRPARDVLIMSGGMRWPDACVSRR
jgi:hypothetical protein